MTSTKSLVFLCKGIEIREQEFSIVKQGEVLPVEPRAFRVLLYLLRNPQRLITKEELLRRYGRMWSLRRTRWHEPSLSCASALGTMQNLPSTSKRSHELDIASSLRLKSWSRGQCLLLASRCSKLGGRAVTALCSRVWLLPRCCRRVGGDRGLGDGPPFSQQLQSHCWPDGGYADGKGCAGLGTRQCRRSRALWRPASIPGRRLWHYKPMRFCRMT